MLFTSTFVYSDRANSGPVSYNYLSYLSSHIFFDSQVTTLNLEIVRALAKGMKLYIYSHAPSSGGYACLSTG